VLRPSSLQLIFELVLLINFRTFMLEPVSDILQLLAHLLDRFIFLLHHDNKFRVYLLQLLFVALMHLLDFSHLVLNYLIQLFNPFVVLVNVGHLVLNFLKIFFFLDVAFVLKSLAPPIKLLVVGEANIRRS